MSRTLIWRELRRQAPGALVFVVGVVGLWAWALGQPTHNRTLQQLASGGAMDRTIFEFTAWSLVLGGLAFSALAGVVTVAPDTAQGGTAFLFRMPASPAQLAMVDRGDAGRIIAAIFEPLERVHEQRRHGRMPDDSNDSAHRKPLSIHPVRRFSRTGAAAHKVTIRFNALQRRWPRTLPSCCFVAVKAAPYFFFFAAWRARSSTARPSRFSCRARPKATASAGTSVVMTLPEAT